MRLLATMLALLAALGVASCNHMAGGDRPAVDQTTGNGGGGSGGGGNGGGY